jgi:predicted hydrolase (HD superfamily)
MTMSRDEADNLFREHVKNEKMLAHSYASEAVMEALAHRLGQDEAKCALEGLLHDMDIEMVGGDLKVHGLAAAKLLTEKSVDDDVVEVIRMQNEMAADEERTSVFHHALAAGKTMKGLITAMAMVYPDTNLPP